MSPGLFDETFINSLADALAPRLKVTAPAVEPRWLDWASAAVKLSTTPAGVRGMARAKRFPVSRIGAKIYIDVRDLEKVMNENKTYLN
jgi:hypothetical protein